MTNEHPTIESAYAHRKDEHLRLAMQQWNDVETKRHNFDEVKLERQLIPSRSAEDVSTSVTMFKHEFEWPFYIEAMTGGSQLAESINRQLAEVARDYHLAMAVGSQSIALKEPATQRTFEVVRSVNPNGFIMANIGIGITVDQAQAAVDMIQADALEVHVNAMQEIGMRDGDRNFDRWQESLTDIIAKIHVPVIIKEVGYGMSTQQITALAALHPAAINVAGAGGTDFGLIEEIRNARPLWRDDPQQQPLLSNQLIGIPTAESLLNAERANVKVPIIANGGIASALDVLKAQALGAQMVGVAGYFLHQLQNNQLEQTIARWQEQLPLLYATFDQ